MWRLAISKVEVEACLERLELDSSLTTEEKDAALHILSNHFLERVCTGEGQTYLGEQVVKCYHGTASDEVSLPRWHVSLASQSDLTHARLYLARQRRFQSISCIRHDPLDFERFNRVLYLGSNRYSMHYTTSRNLTTVGCSVRTTFLASFVTRGCQRRFRRITQIGHEHDSSRNDSDPYQYRRYRFALHRCPDREGYGRSLPRLFVALCKPRNRKFRFILYTYIQVVSAHLLPSSSF